MISIPIIEGPIAGPSVPFLMSTPSNQVLTAAGYETKEYFISGTAISYRNVNELPANGIWEVEPMGSAAYKTRIIVCQPLDVAKFNGTVVMEWLNVSGGLDYAPDWIFMHNELLRRGYIWIGVSAQCGGVEGHSSISLGNVKLDLKTADPQRYGSLTHPGDEYCYDIYSQAARAIRSPGSVNLLAGCHADRILAVGESQSAMHLTSYVNAIQLRDQVFDGFLLHGRSGFALFENNSTEVNSKENIDFSDMDQVFIRTDINVPVLILESETDLMLLGYYKARQDDTDKIRLWEMAGTAHADLYLLTGKDDTGNDPSFANVVEVARPNSGFADCDLPINAGPQHFITRAAIHQLDKWVCTGVAPTAAARLEIAGNPPELVLDELGNVKGGIRTPFVDVPVARLSGLGLYGTTKLFDKVTLSKLYPDHHTYVKAVGKATDAAVQSGFLLAEDGELIKAAATASDIGNP